MTKKLKFGDSVRIQNYSEKYNGKRAVVTLVDGYYVYVEINGYELELLLTEVEYIETRKSDVKRLLKRDYKLKKKERLDLQKKQDILEKEIAVLEYRIDEFEEWYAKFINKTGIQ